ncbi:MAG: hypothetical protein IPM56_08805 [Ignavibacteriales bacterium]|nr:MAG: hypothetical protein IPM56_08805 [Ignavibacteriales bacterium]
MDFAKIYIAQSISAAANNLRLNNQQIEVIALLRESLIKADSIEEQIRSMKKVTELSTLAIRLSEIMNYLTHGQIDLFKVSEKFRDHSQFLIKDLSHMLEMVNPSTLKASLEKVKAVITSTEKTDNGNSMLIDPANRNTSASELENPLIEDDRPAVEVIDSKDKEAAFFQNYESSVLKPIKQIDLLLKSLPETGFDKDNLLNLSSVMEKNGKLSSRIGFEIIAGMHNTISRSLGLIAREELIPDKEIIESIRACLIVIVAVVRGKEVDITAYLNKAESFGNSLNKLIVKENS